MTKKEKIKLTKHGPLIITSEALFEARKPRYNGFAAGYGAHGKRKYDRNAAKRRPLD